MKRASVRRRRSSPARVPLTLIETSDRVTRMMNHKSRTPLRLLLVTDDGTIPNWLHKCLHAVEESKVATVVLALHAARKEGRNLRRLLFSLYERIDRHLFRSVADALVRIDLQSALPTCRVVNLQHALATGEHRAGSRG